MFRVGILLALLSSFTFADFGADLEEEERENSWWESRYQEIDRNHQELENLFEGNLDCLNGTQKMLENKTCYLTYLSIMDIQNGDEYYGQEKRNMISILASRCPEWREYQIKDCK